MVVPALAEEAPVVPDQLEVQVVGSHLALPVLNLLQGSLVHEQRRCACTHHTISPHVLHIWTLAQVKPIGRVLRVACVDDWGGRRQGGLREGVEKLSVEWSASGAKHEGKLRRVNNTTAGTRM